MPPISIARSLRRVSLAALVVLVAASTPSISFAADGFKRESLDDAFRQLAATSIVPAFAVVGVERSGEQYAYFHGNALWDGERRLNADSIFRIYSMTKPIASVAAMQLVEQGKMSLDDSVARWLPEIMAIPILQADGSLTKSERPITVRMLLTHTSGFAYTFTSPALADFKKPADWKHKDGPRIFEPGARWHYGTSTDWLGRLIEKISGMDLEAYLKKNVTGPLGMERTFFVVPEALRAEIVSFGNLVEGKRPAITEDKSLRTRNLDPTEYSAGGGLFSTARDYAKFLRMILNDGSLNGTRILQKQTIELMAQNQIGELSLRPIPNFTGADKFGFGWAIETNDQSDVRAPGTLYWAGAANTYFSIDRKKGKAVIVLANFMPMLNKNGTALFEESQRLLYK